MKKFLIFISLFFFSVAFADELSDVREFFDSYIKAANSYKKNIPDYYSPEARIIRVVIKPDGSKQSVEFNVEDYMRQLKKRSKLARIVRYKNRYEDIQVSELGSGKYKISALRYPMRDKIGLNFYFIVENTDNGYKVIEESMETDVQDFLKYAK